MFHFDVVESTSLLSSGNVFPSIHAIDASEPMIYGVFTTPRLVAVCNTFMLLYCYIICAICIKYAKCRK